MTLDKTVNEKMKNDRTLTERISSYIPIYRGYKDKNLRRDEDRAVRTEVARTLEGVKADLATIQRETVGNLDLMRNTERIRSKTDKYHTDVKKAVNGYSSFHASVKITEQELDALVAWDARIMDDVVSLREQTATAAELAGSDPGPSIKELEKTVDRLLDDYNGRERVMRGFEEGGDSNVR